MDRGKLIPYNKLSKINAYPKLFYHGYLELSPCFLTRYPTLTYIASLKYYQWNNKHCLVRKKAHKKSKYFQKNILPDEFRLSL